MKQICIYEDEKVSNFNPLVYLRPVYELRCGIFTLREKIEKRINGIKPLLHTRKFMEDFVKEENPGYSVNNFESDKILFLNGRVIFPDEFYAGIENISEEQIFLINGSIAAAYLSVKNFGEIVKSNHALDFGELLLKLPSVEIEGKIFEYPWELVYANGEEIVADFSRFFPQNDSADIADFNGVYSVGDNKIFVGKNCNIMPTVVLDTSHGPIIIDDEVEIMPQSTISGPAYIGNKSKIKIGAKIYHDTTIGEVCKVGGEVENTIIHSYSNKQHDGFLGHSYLGQWVNLGAGTNNSDLKNNYGEITVKVNRRPVKTGLQFVGLIMGDHSKSAIGTQFNTGTVVGISSNIFGEGFPPRYIPSFSWGGAEFLKVYKLEKSLEVAGLVMLRRNHELTPALQKLFQDIFNLTANERTSFR